MRTRAKPLGERRTRRARSGRSGDGRRSGVLRFALLSGAVTGGVGAIAGLVIGVHVNAATAPFAAVELGLPAAAVGLVVGTLIGALVGTHR